MKREILLCLMRGCALAHYEHASRVPLGQSFKALDSENSKRGLRLSLVGDR